MSEFDISECETITKEFSKGAVVWYDFGPDSSLLYLYSKHPDLIVEKSLKQNGVVTACEISELTSVCSEKAIFDYIVGIDVIEECKAPLDLLKFCHKVLKTDGRLILGTENRYAIKYICGDRDPYTNHSFDGIENYRRLSYADKNLLSGRCYSMAELRDLLADSGFVDNKFYSVMPSLQNAQLIYAEGYTPKEELAMRYFPLYNYPNSVFLEEQFLYTDLIKNGMFHKMANAYVVECSLDGNFDDTLHATISLDRGCDNALVTGIHNGGNGLYVEKRTVYEQGIQKLTQMQNNLEELKNRGIRVVDSCIKGNRFIMPYVDRPVAMNALKDLAKKDKDLFLNAMDAMYELILHSSEHTDEISDKDKNSANGRDLGPILLKGYIDMVPLNCFYDVNEKDFKKRFIYYDQEFYWKNCPAKAIMYRSITIIYDKTDEEFEHIVPQELLLERYGLAECQDIWIRMSARFTDTLRNQRTLLPYYENTRTDGRILYTNREKINYSTKEYQKLFVDIFDEAENKKIVLFGSGRFAEKFLFQFGDDYPIYAIVDNNCSKWGTSMGQIPIISPDELKEIPPKERHVIICIKGYNGVINQLRSMGITEYHIYDPGNDYPNKKRMAVAQKLNSVEYISKETEEKQGDKPYNIGYIAGVFDLFHIGHLNMFKRAKELCRYLIVGVVSDEGVRLNKQAEPFVPFEERIELVRSCRYVDEAVKLPLNFAGTRDMFKLYHFDVQFSGSDYEHDSGWLAEKEFLEKNGATMVFFPYTQSTSSTKLKLAIEKKIDKQAESN